MENISYRFTKTERLTSKIIIQAIFDKGIVIYLHPFKVFYKISEATDNRILITVPKRLHKRAVDRNLIKRRIREAYRLNKTILTSDISAISVIPFVDINIVYTSGELLEFKQITKKLSDVLAKIKKNVTVAKKSANVAHSTSFRNSD
jgi:ribonuclease P protein component